MPRLDSACVFSTGDPRPRHGAFDEMRKKTDGTFYRIFGEGEERKPNFRECQMEKVHSIILGYHRAFPQWRPACYQRMHMN